MNDDQEQLAEQIDRLDNLAHALQIPMPAQMHVENLKSAIPSVVADLKKAFTALTHYDPWQE